MKKVPVFWGRCRVVERGAELDSGEDECLLETSNCPLRKSVLKGVCLTADCTKLT